MDLPIKLFFFVVILQISSSSLINHRLTKHQKTMSLLSENTRKMALIECTKNAKIELLRASLHDFITSHPNKAEEAFEAFSFFLYNYESSCLSDHKITHLGKIPNFGAIKEHLKSSKSKGSNGSKDSKSNSNNTKALNETLLNIALSMLDAYIESTLNLTTVRGKNETKTAKNIIIEKFNNITLVIEVLNVSNSSALYVGNTGNITYDATALENFIQSILNSTQNLTGSESSMIIDIASVVLGNGALAFSVVAAIVPSPIASSNSTNSEPIGPTALKIWESIEKGVKKAEKMNGEIRTEIQKSRIYEEIGSWF